MKFKSILAVLALPLIGTTVAADEHDRARALREAGTILPLERILENVRADRPGRVIEAELERRDGALAYEIEVVDDDGVVWELWYDAGDGTLIESERE